MSRNVLWVGMGIAAAGLIGQPRPVAADDWLQFRHDDRRTAVSRDRLQLPLTDVWTMPGYGTATWHGKAFYLGPDGARAAVYCADVRTGATRWKQPLSMAWSELWNQLPLQRTPVAVSSEGVVYVQDSQPGTHGFVFPVVRSSSSGFVHHPFGNVPRGVFRTFRATDGTPLAVVNALPRDVPVPQVALYDGVAGGLPPMQPVLRGLLPVGPALILGNEVVASSLDCLFRWTPGNPADLLSLAHLRPPVPNDLGVRDVTMGGFPATNSGTGFLVGGMAWLEVGTDSLVGDKQFLAHMSGGRCQWHKEYPFSLGFPTVDKGLVIAGAAGPFAREAVIAHDVATGAVRWVYPQGGPRADSVGSVASVDGRRGVNVAAPHAYVRHPGVPVSGDRAYAAVGRSIVALSVERGEPIWTWQISGGTPGEMAQSLVVTPGFLLVSLDRETAKRSGNGFQSSHSGRLVALRLTDGKAVWSQELPGGGDLAASDGLLFHSDGNIRAFAPTERTYRMAVDSARPEDYDAQSGLNRDPSAPAADAAQPEGKISPGLADASVVRLHWGEPVEAMLQQLRERRAATPGLPLLVSLDWLDPTRTTIRGGQAGWSPREAEAFAALCERLAREVRPEHLDLAPEVDVYLSRDLSRLPAVRGLLRSAVAAIKRASPQTKVLLSLNREVLSRQYGRGSYTPFGKLTLPSQEAQGQLLSLLAEVDEVGLTSIPQSAFNSPLEIPGDYLLGLKATLPKKPVLLTRLAVRWEETSKAPAETQATYLKRLLQTVYWLNAGLVAYPELLGTKSAELALRAESQDRLALAYWRNTLQWKRVAQLTAPAAELEQKMP